MTRGGFDMRRLLISLPLTALGCAPAPTQGAEATDLEHALDREARKLLDQGVSDRFVIGVVKRGRTLVRGFGDRPWLGDASPDGDRVFQIGSLTKLFTVATLLSLAEEGVVSLDDDLSRCLGGGVPLSPRAGAITLRQLASHTSGLPLVPKPLTALPRDPADPYSQLSREVVYRYLATAEGLRPPGRLEYSNYGMGLLGHLLEDRAGAPLERLMAARLFTPLSMSSTVMTPRDGAARLSALTPGVSQTGAAAAVWRFGALGGAGGLCSSANDMLTFLQANLATDGPLSSVLGAMHRERGPHDARLGWFAPSMIDRVAGNRTLVWHNGRVGGYASYLSIDVKQRTGVVILSAKSAELALAGAMLSRAVRDNDWRET